MTTYQDVVAANLPIGAWALVEASGTDFAPYIGPYHLTGSGTLLYQQSGPFAASLALHQAAGASLRTTGLTLPAPPVTIECWINFDVYPPTGTSTLFFWGNGSLNGSGLFITTSGQIHYYVGPAANVDTNTGVAIGSGWHLVQLGNVSGTTVAVALDGKIILQLVGANVTAGNPNQVSFGGSNPGGAERANNVSFPAIYNSALTPSLAYSTFLAKTDPAAALGYTLGNGAVQNDLLNKIYAAVHRVY